MKINKILIIVKTVISYFGATCFGMYLSAMISGGVSAEKVLGAALAALLAVCAYVGAKEEREEG